MPAAEDEDPVGAFAADGADPAFGDSVRAGRTYRRADNFYLFRGEHGIETSDELGVAIPGIELGSASERLMVLEPHKLIPLAILLIWTPLMARAAATACS